jgi:hypothetical protein
MIKTFILTKQTGKLPWWFNCWTKAGKSITINKIHFIANSDTPNEYLKAKILNKEQRNVSVHSNLSSFNYDDQSGCNDQFICFTNEKVSKKFEIITSPFEEVKFWFCDINGAKINEEDIMMLKIDMTLETVLEN